MANFHGADPLDKAVALWHADLAGLEQDLCEKEAIEARVWDLYRNSDLLHGLIEKQVDTQIGSRVSLQALPNYKALGVSREEAAAWSDDVENKFHAWAHSPENWVSADRSMDFTQFCRSACRMRKLTGEVFMSLEMRPSRIGPSTTFQLISPSRVKTPSRRTGFRVFHGIELDRFGAAFGYHIETARLDQKRSFGNKQTKRYTRYNRFGLPQLFHIYEPMRPEYPRGISRLACVLKLMKQRDRYMEADLDKAIIAASYAMVITSDEDADSVALALAGAVESSKGRMAIGGSTLSPEQEQVYREEYARITKDRYAEVTGGRWIHGFKGEEFNILDAPSNTGPSVDYLKGYTKPAVNGAGGSYELSTGDFSDVNFASGQMSLGIYEYSASIQRRLYDHKVAKFVWRAWLDEQIAIGRDNPGEGVRELGNAPYFGPGENRDHYTRCNFTGAKRVHVDPLKDAKANQLRISNGTSSRSEIVADNGGDMDAIMSARADDGVAILQAVKTSAERCGLELSDEAQLKILIDAVATATIDVPENVSDTALE